jgi:aspartate/methionine/tyrosine aminotransferase
MKITPFKMERMQCLYEHRVDYNLSESGVLPLRLEELLGGPEETQRLLAHELRYCESDGSALLRDQIARFYPDCSMDNVTVTNGGSEANYVTLWTLLDRDSRLACMVPNYMQAWGLGRAYAGRVDPFRLVLREKKGERRWTLDQDELERAVTKKTKVILVCNPNNPTGAVLSEQEMDAVVEVAGKANAWLVADEIYRGAEVEGETTPTFWGRYDKVIITSGLSKAFGLPGLRIGWVVAPPKLIEKLWIHHDYITLVPSLLGDRLATIAMEPERREALFARTRGILRANLPPLEAWIEGHGDLFTYARPKAGAIAYVKYDLPVKSGRLVKRLREEQSVLLVPGSQFGLGKGLRIGYGYDLDKTLAGLARLDTLIDEIRS